ncbi:trehalose-phosphatase [Blastococcus saxobsidens]|uniref:Trehalose 6-phosphate phosphatase n=1 Tax=Blastococcus saxobsidens (strain DD2) TaxID=1146883 RepID=H6RV30_BLASD|nr:trehalose-phosphatase [Blastococcus saxobsidens]CCG05749.1 Trehalose 6-phosphatase [Blastococcus saxobsidens DD2]
MTSSPALDDAVAAIAGRRPLLVASDYDGVLARLRDDPAAAVPEPGVAEVLARLAAVEGVTVALVSGRGADDLRRTSGLSGPFRWIGSHGAEYDGPLVGELAGRRDELARRLEPLVAGTPGARLEVKPVGVAVHVRQVADRERAAALLAEARQHADSSLTMKPGKDVLEMAVTDADKGSALRRLVVDLGAAAAVYLGDDVTDEDGFRALGPDDVTVKVGAGDTAARFRVAGLADAVALLGKLADRLV